jgi:hypothetical protein
VITTDASVWYWPLPLKCSCKKVVTIEERNILVSRGIAHWVYNRWVERDPHQIWMAQQAQVPRIDLISKADIERAYVDDLRESMQYIEEVHDLFMKNRAELIREYSLDWVDPTKDELLFPFGPDQRTDGGHK